MSVCELFVSYYVYILLTWFHYRSIFHLGPFIFITGYQMMTWTHITYRSRLQIHFLCLVELLDNPDSQLPYLKSIELAPLPMLLLLLLLMMTHQRPTILLHLQPTNLPTLMTTTNPNHPLKLKNQQLHGSTKTMKHSLYPSSNWPQ